MGILMSIPQCFIMEIPDHKGNTFMSQRHSVDDSINIILLSIAGNSSEKLHCWNVVNMPYWTDRKVRYHWKFQSHLFNELSTVAIQTQCV